MKRTDLALAALASAAVPGMKPVTVARMSVERGAENELEQAVVEDATGRRWLVRSPLTAMAGARLHRNDELVRQLTRHLPFKVPAAAGYAAVGGEGHAAVYPHVEGATLDFTRLPAGAGLAHAVGRAVAAIHNIPAAVFEEQDVPSFDAAGWRQRLIAEVDRAAETGRVPTRLLGRWEEAFDASPLWQFASTPVHGSFRGATVVVAFADDEADSGRVVAVTDWDEAMVGDPAADLAEVYSQASPEAWESVLDSYALARAQRPDPYLHARARLLSETGRLRGLAQHVASGDEESARRVVEVLRRMDRLTEDEDSLVPTTARGGGAAAAAVVAGRTEREEDPAPVGDPDPHGDATGLEAGPSWGSGAAEQDAPVERAAPGEHDVPVEQAASGEHDAPVEQAHRSEADPSWSDGQPVLTGPPEGGEELDEEDDDHDGYDAVPRPDPYLDDGDPDPHPDDQAADPGPGPSSAAAQDAGADTDITTEVPVVRPGGPGDQLDTPLDPEPEQTDGSDPQPDQDDAPEDAELLDDDTRLHELYGMPSEEDPGR
ncbi:phosphotransferase [Serinicoccus chungangensis]|uniref:phosphotransferase n=1 Tax=Serinicoccus chungangensis TaxID=767452 RepID=UPI00130536C5|nr:phosphotransferase [Serinicoccus chungangensis]